MATRSDYTDVAELLARPSPHDVLAAIVAYSELEIFTSDRQRLHDFIRRTKEQKAEAGDLLAAFVFSKGADAYPFSRMLENTIVHLQLGRVIYAKNPEFDRLGMTDEARGRAKEKAEAMFDEQSLRSLQLVGRAFADALRE